MQDVVGSSTGSRIKILSAGLPAARDATPLAQIPLGDGVRTAAELRLTKHTNLDAKDAAACEVILLQSVYKKVNEHLREDTAREHGGFLYGYESTFGQDNTPVVVVTDAIPAKFTEGTPVRLIFTMETWRELDDEVVRRYGEAQGAPQQVGWYHSHPNIRIFLSSWDLDVCTTYERRRYPLALVADPINDKGGCFVGGAKGYDPRSPQGFYEAHDLRDDASVVTWKNVSQRTDLAVAPTERRMRAEGVEMEIQSAGKRALAAPKPLKIKIPWAKRVDTLLARVGYALVVVLLLGVIGYLAATQIRQQRDIVKLQQASQQHTSTPTASQTTAPPEETHEPVPGQTVASSVKTPGGSSSSGPKSGGVQAAALPPAKPTVSVSPHDVTLEASKTHRFQTTIQGPAKDRKVGVRWSLLPSGLGTVDPNGVYTAPKAIADNATVKVIATSIANPKVRDQWTVMLVKSLQTSTAKSSANGASGSEAAGKDPADSKAAAGNDAPSPPAPAFKVVGETMLMEGKSVTFKAELGGQPVKATWSMAPGSVGKLSEADGDGSYTAPDSVNTETTVKIVAHKADDATVTDTLTLTIKPHGTAKIDRNREGAGQETDAGRVTVMEKAQALNRGARRV